MALEALIFDVDGTLADTERDGHRIAFNRAFAEANLDWNWSEELYGELLTIAGGKERLRFYQETYQPSSSGESGESGESGDRDSIATLHQSKSQHYKRLLSENLIPLRPGVKRLILQAQAAGIRLAIATTSSLDSVITLLETALAPGSSAWFEVIAAGDSVPAKKPAPDVYQYVLQQMNVSPAVCLAIEDSYQGLQAATQAGLRTLITLNDYTRDHDFSGAWRVLDHLGEPTQPFQVIAGPQTDATHLDLALLRSWLS